jgi:hypothetical protein
VIAFASQSAFRRRAERERDTLRETLTKVVARTTPPAGGGSIQPHPTKDGVFVLSIETTPRHIDALREWGRRTFPSGGDRRQPSPQRCFCTGLNM